MTNKYKGIGYIGNSVNSGIYGMSGGIIDAKGTGIQHLFYKKFDIDYIHSACTMIKIGDNIYYGNKKEHRLKHQTHLFPTVSKNIKGCIYYDKYDLEGIIKEDFMGSREPNIISFRTKLTNLTTNKKTIDIYAYLNANSNINKSSKTYTNKTVIDTKDAKLGIICNNTDKNIVVLDAPTGFLYKTTQTLFYNENNDLDKKAINESMSILRGKTIELEPNKEVIFDFSLVFADTINEIVDENVEKGIELSIDSWNEWFEKGYNLKLENKQYEQILKVNLMGIKSSLLNGFVPADLTGHYFANGTPCYYARDAMMIARAFLSSGHFEEFKSIMNYLVERETKNNGEFHQRYNGLGDPDEGANNNVFHQLDSIGFFFYNVRKYYNVFGEYIVDYNYLKNLLKVIESSDKKNGLVGIEGGVNEGVYGGAYITSSNAFISGGLLAMQEFAKENNDNISYELCSKLILDIHKGIESTYIQDEKRYAYGYVEYSNELVKKFDSPLYFGTLYGWPNSKKMETTNKYYLNYANYFDYGIGYSEQEYHHGPWMFNTLACAQYNYSISNFKVYNNIINWVLNHANAYGLLPEAIDAENENNCFINPLTWACAEMVNTLFLISGGKVNE